MKVLVTGSNGLIGHWVVERLQQEGIATVGVDRTEAPPEAPVGAFFQCDILDRTRLERVFTETKPDAVVHLAARIDLRETKRLEGYAANIDGVRNVIAAVQAAGSVRRAVYASSQLVCRIGYVPSGPDDYCPDTLYGESKVWTERLVRESDGGGVPWCLVRPTTVWGPRMSPHYQNMIRLIQRGLYFHVGRSKLHKSYGYAGNTAWQIFKLLTAPEAEIQRKVFYLADYTPLSLTEYANALQAELGARRIPSLPLPLARALAGVGDVLNLAGWRRFPFNSFRLRNILTEYVHDLGPTRAVCGTLPYNFQDGVAATAQWFKELKAGENIQAAA